MYDPTLTLREALESGCTRMHLINANGMTAISLGLHYREAEGKTPAYDYGLSVSTIPAAEVACDVARDPAAKPCTLSLFLQFASFDRQVSRQSAALGLGVSILSLPCCLGLRCIANVFRGTGDRGGRVVFLVPAGGVDSVGAGAASGLIEGVLLRPCLQSV